MTTELHSFVRLGVSREKAFFYFFSMNLLQVFQGIWFAPRVVPDIIKNRSAKTGSERLIYFHDNSTALYKLLSFDFEVSFSASINDFTSKRFNILKAMYCHFSFLDAGFGIIQVHCRYQFKLCSAFYGLLYKLFLKRYLQCRLDSVMFRAAEELNFYVEWEKTLL